MELFLRNTSPLTFNLFVTFVVFLPFAPIIFRYSPVIWMHVEYRLDSNSPQRQG